MSGVYSRSKSPTILPRPLFPHPRIMGLFIACVRLFVYSMDDCKAVSNRRIDLMDD